MPLTSKDREVLSSFEDQYGREAGKRRFYASINAGKVRNIPEARRMARKRHKAHRKVHRRKAHGRRM